VRQGAGSGFVWDEQATSSPTITSCTAVASASACSLSDGTTFEAALVGCRAAQGPRRAVAIAAEAPLHPVKLADSHQLLVGQKVLAIGNPFGLDSRSRPA
jgi:S1-C subfamily serine protease